MDENEKPAPDVDAMDDATFEAFKSEIRKEPETPAVEAKPEAIQPADDDGEPSDDNVDEQGNRKSVPHGQYHKERERRKAAEAAQEQLRVNYERLMERTQQLLTPQQQPQEPPPIPQWDENAIEAGAWTQQQVIELKNQLAEQQRQAQQQYQAQQYWQQTIQVANEQFAEAERADPSVRDAYNALRASYGAELKALGHSVQSAEQELARIEAEGIRYALENRIPVADYVRNLAQARGWQKQAQPTTINGQQSDAQRLARDEQTRIASMSLGKGGGAVVNTGVPTPEDLLDMSDADFEAFKKKHGGSIAAAFGG